MYLPSLSLFIYLSISMRQRTAGGAAEAALQRIAGPLLRLR